MPRGAEIPEGKRIHLVCHYGWRAQNPVGSCQTMCVKIVFKIIGAVALVALASCSGRRAIRPEAMIPPECEAVPRPTERADTVRVALFEAVRPEHAPAARNAGERLMFRQLYETLITVDCLGEVRAGLAVSWDRGDGGRRWTFELRENARFWDGTPVTAYDVTESWRYTALYPASGGSNEWGAGIDSVTVDGDRVLHVYFTERHREVPLVLAASRYAVAKSTWESRWPFGSGPYRIIAAERESPWASWRTITVQPVDGRKEQIIRFVEASRGDARDLLEGGIDLMVTSDPAVIEYAGRRFSTVPLPWDRIYVLLSRSRVGEMRWSDPLDAVPDDFSDGLARDAVRGDARGFRPPSWWEDLGRCGGLSVTAPRFPLGPKGTYPQSDRRRILYDADDPVARDIAERIVALSTTDPAASKEAAAIIDAVPDLDAVDPPVTAEGVTKRELDERLREGYDFAYIVPIERRPHDPCRQARALMDRVRWLAGMEDRLHEAIIPLVETRPHVIVREGTAGVIVDWYGDVLITDGDWEER